MKENHQVIAVPRLAARSRALWVVPALVLLSFDARAAVVVGDPTFNETDALVFGSPFDAVVSIWADGNSGTGILIDETTVLTAKHVTDGASPNRIFVDFNDTNNDRIDMRPPAGGGTFIEGAMLFEAADSASPNLIDGTDLAIITLDTAVTTITPMRLLSDMSYAVGREAAMVGFGLYGVGDGPRPLSWEPRRRGGTNIVDFYGAGSFPGGFYSNSSNIFSTDFDDGTSGNNTLSHVGSNAAHLARETTTASGDSGGPLLVNVGGEYLVVGVLSGGTTPESVFGDISHWTGVGPYQSTIESYGGTFFFSGFASIPEPGTTAFLFFGVTLLTAGRGVRPLRVSGCDEEAWTA